MTRELFLSLLRPSVSQGNCPIPHLFFAGRIWIEREIPEPFELIALFGTRSRQGGHARIEALRHVHAYEWKVVLLQEPERPLLVPLGEPRPVPELDGDAVVGQSLGALGQDERLPCGQVVGLPIVIAGGEDRHRHIGQIVPRDVFLAAGEHGFLGMAIPTEHGGGGNDDFRYNLVIGEEIQAAAVNAAGLGITLHNDICLPYFLRYCDEGQRRRWLPGIASGELITAIAMTEPGIGSDLASMSTTAIRDGDRYVVNGSKTFITNGINADLVITAVKTDPTQRHKGMSLLVLERGMEGFERGRNLDKIGLHAQDTAELFFNGVQVPVDNLLGGEGEGFTSLVSNLPQERL